MAVDVREATDEDEPAVTERLLRPAYRDAERVAPEFNGLDADAVADADAGRWLDREDRALFVAEADGHLVGYVSGVVSEAPPIYDRGDEVHVDGLYVVPDYRRRGIAGDLLDRVEAWGERRGCAYVGVTVHADDGAAGRLYDERYELTFRSYRSRIE